MANKKDKQPLEHSNDLNQEGYQANIENRKRERKVVRRIVMSIIAVLVVLLIVFGITAYNFYTTSLEPLDKNSQEELQIEVPPGSSSTKIAKILEKQGIINSASVFNIYTRLKNESGFRAGYYLFSPSMTIDSIITQLQKGGSDRAFDAAKKITIREGLTIPQIADAIGKDTSYSSKEFLHLIEDKSFLDNMSANYPELLTSAIKAKETKYVLEGYLFPATYDYYEDTSLESIVENMISKTDEVLKGNYQDIKEKGKSVQEVMTIASLVEREAIHDQDRSKVASVFYNRLEAGMPLQSDISILYALDTHKEKVSLEDLKVDSPYNLYLNTGYGPGPFNNPSKKSILATLNPERSDDLYFLADLKTGKVYFSKTYKEHLANKAKYLDK